MFGIDVSKATLSGTLVDPQQRRPLWTLTVPHTPDGIRTLLARTPHDCPWVLEPTGRLSHGVARQAHAAGRTVLLAPPKQAKAFLAAVTPRAKTDRLDSHGLALYALAAPLAPYPLKSDAVEHLDQLLAARAGIARSLARLRQQRAALPYAADPLTAAIAALEAQRAELDRQIAAQTKAAALPAVAELDRVPGIGPVTAATVAACLATKHFRHPDQFVAYIGLDVRVRDSGQRRGQRALTKQGHAELRRLLYLCAQANLRSRDPHNPFKAQYLRERAKGLSTTGALCAVARKLARTCWSLARHDTRYDPARVNRQLHAHLSQDQVHLDTEP